MGAQWLSGRVLDSRPRGRGFKPHRRHCVVSLSKNINPTLVLVLPRKTRPFITERLLMGRKESNQTNKQTNIECWIGNFVIFQAIWTRIAKKPYIFVIFQGSLAPLSPSGSAHAVCLPYISDRIIPSGKSGMCIQKDKNFLIVFSCSSLTSMFGQDACDNSLIRRYCCEPCPQPGVKGIFFCFVA